MVPVILYSVMGVQNFFVEMSFVTSTIITSMINAEAFQISCNIF
jgi:hypothetical protein